MTTKNGLLETATLHQHITPSFFSQNEASRSWPYDLDTTIRLLLTVQRKLEAAEHNLIKQSGRMEALETLAMSDCLTGLANRRGFEAAIARECDRTKRGLSKGGIYTLIDLDNFKTINDQYGHDCGDACLKLVAERLRNLIRPMDIAARLGGDEFALLMPDSNKADIARRVQKILYALNKASLAWQGDTIQIRASAGLKSYAAADTPESIYTAADKKLYANKNERKKKS